MRPVALPVAAVLLVAALAGCAQQKDAPRAGSSDATPTSAAPTTPVAAANAQALARQIKAATADLPTVTVTLQTQVTGAGKATARFGGAIRMAPAAKAGMDLTMTTTEGGKTETGRIIVLNRVFYIQQKGGELAPGKSWLRLSRADLAALTDPAAAQLKATLQQLFDQLDQSLDSASPADNLVLLDKGKLTGAPKTETAGGETVTRYSGATQISALAEEAQYAQLSELGVTQLTWEFSVDANGLPRQFTMTLPIKTSKGAVHTATTATYSKWGEPVSITAPPAAQVATVSDLGH
jgi:hypothetical protein